jgi:O-antigen ligase
MVTAALVTVPWRARQAEAKRLRRIGIIWALLFFNVLQTPSGGVLPIPHRVAQVMTQGALAAAVVLAVTVNPKVRIRSGGFFLPLFSVLALSSLMMSIRFVSVGAGYRAFRLIAFLVVIWLLTPWWGSRSMILLRSHRRFLVILLVSVFVGLLVSPHKALPNNRLSGAIWPIAATQVAHYAAELVGLTLLLWACGMAKRRSALWVVIPGVAAVLATHTRTALLAALIGLLAAGLSLFVASRRVRRAFAVVIVAGVVVGLPLSSLITSWAARGENSSQITTLTGRTKAWALVFSAPRPETNKIFGSGMSNGGVNIQPNRALDGLAIDSGWISTYQDQGLFGDVIEGAIFFVLLVTALMRPRSPARAMALFLIMYCFVASFTESGMGQPSAYLLDLTVAASLLALPPSGERPDLAFGGARS